MFESNFPPDRKACSYTVLWNAFKKFSAPYSKQEKAALFMTLLPEFTGFSDRLILSCISYSKVPV
jgi:hypothetical protein